MPLKASTGTVSKYGHLSEQRFLTYGQPASWETDRADTNYAELRASKHEQAGWLTVTIREQGTKTARQTTFTFTKEQVNQLRKFISPTPTE